MSGAGCEDDQKASEQVKQAILLSISFLIDFNVIFHSPEPPGLRRSFMKLTMAGMFLSVPLLFAMHAWLDTIAKRDSYGQEAWQHDFHMFSPKLRKKHFKKISKVFWKICSHFMEKSNSGEYYIVTGSSARRPAKMRASLWACWKADGWQTPMMLGSLGCWKKSFAPDILGCIRRLSEKTLDFFLKSTINYSSWAAGD